MTKRTNYFLILGGIAIVIFGIALLLRSEPIAWKEVEAYGYSFNVPSDWELRESEYRNRLGQYEGTVKRQAWFQNVVAACDQETYLATLEIGQDEALSEEEAYDLIRNQREGVLLEQELSNGTVLVMGKEDAFAHGPCRSSRYIGLVLGGDTVTWFKLEMDEERNDIVMPIYRSIATQEL